MDAGEATQFAAHRIDGRLRADSKPEGMNLMPRANLTLRIGAMAMSGLLATATAWADATADLVNALDTKAFDGDAVRRAVAAGADVNVHICHQQFVTNHGALGTDRRDGAVKFGDQCGSADGFWYTPVWAVYGRSFTGPIFKERMQWVQYFREHHAKLDPLFGGQGNDLCLAMNEVLYGDDGPNSRLSQVYAERLTAIVKDGWKSGPITMVRCIDDKRRSDGSYPTQFAIFRRVGKDTGHLPEIDQALRRFAKRNQIVDNFPMAPAPGDSIAPQKNSMPYEMPAPVRGEKPMGNESDAGISTHAPVPSNVDIGTKVCQVTQGTAKQHTGYVVLGHEAIETKDGIVTMTGFVEGKNKSRIQVRISGLLIQTNDGNTHRLTDFRYGGSVLTANSVIWDPASLWELCN